MSSVSNAPVPPDIALSTYDLVAALSALVGAPLNVNAPVSVPPVSGNTVVISVSVYDLAALYVVVSPEFAYDSYAVVIAISLVSVYNSAPDLAAFALEVASALA